jgi:hypothetical protein
VEDIFPSWFQVPTASIITTLKYYQAQWEQEWTSSYCKYDLTYKIN